MARELGLEDRFQQHSECALDHAVSNRWNRDDADLAALLRNLPSSVRSGAVRLLSQLRRQFPKKLVPALLLDHLERNAVGPGGAVIALRLQVRGFERVELREVHVHAPEAMRRGGFSPMAYPRS